MLLAAQTQTGTGRRNSIISGEAAKNNTRIRIFLYLFSKKNFSKPLNSGEAAASPASPVPTPLIVLKKFENAGAAGETEN